MLSDYSLFCIHESYGPIPGSDQKTLWDIGDSPPPHTHTSVGLPERQVGEWGRKKMAVISGRKVALVKGVYIF